ncbi:MAG: AAA family ATPase [Caldilineaceae bacterium]|nr:AAA family ATPase [Caldilineaceae bacterium]
MTIQRLIRIQGCGVFSDYRWPNTLSGFQKYNLIYGWNGSGKTTISRIFRDLQLQKQPQSGNVIIDVDGKQIKDSTFPNNNVPIRVFNQDFVKENVFPTTGNKVQPIFVLGAENIQNQLRIDELKQALDQKTETVEIKQRELENTTKKLDRHCQDNARKIKTTLTSQTSRAYANYNKSHYQKRAHLLIEENSLTSYMLSDEVEQKLMDQHLARQKDPVDVVQNLSTDFSHLKNLVVKLVNTEVSSRVIQSLKTDAEVETWVRDGHSLHRDRGKNKCLYCDSKIRNNRWDDLESHFNDAYQTVVNSINFQLSSIETETVKYRNAHAPDKARIYAHLQDEYENAQRILDNHVLHAQNFLDALNKILQEKKNSPFTSVELPGSLSQMPRDNAVEKLNEVILKHNCAVDNHVTAANDARIRLEDRIVAESVSEFQDLNNLICRLKEQIECELELMVDIKSDVEKLEQSAIEHQTPAENFNSDLAKYYGHSELSLVVEGNGYAVHRGGTRAVNLSEGETTAVALLYFLQSLSDHRFDLRRGIVVLDDPISSLDSNSLYSAYSYVVERTKDAGQLFILTHNLAFFRLIKRWFKTTSDRHEKQSGNVIARFLMLQCLIDGDSRHSDLVDLDSLLMRFDSDYQYLFACVYRSVAESDMKLGDHYLLPNAARRILETFLA